MIRRLVWLGWRLRTQRTYEAGVRSLLFALGITLTTLVALVGVSLPSALHAQQDHANSLELKYSETDRHHAFGLSEDDLSDRRWEGVRVARVLVSHDEKSGTDLKVPGIPRFPKTGEAYISPALASEAKNSAALGALISEYKIVGTISNSGLVSPDEKRAVIGITSSTKWLRPLAPFSTAASPAPVPTLPLIVVAVISMLVVVPGAIFIAICARLGTRQRASRIQGLHQLGLSRAQIRIVLIIEALAVTIPSTIAGTCIYWLFVYSGGAIPGTEFSFFPADLMAPWQVTLLAVVAIVGVCAISASAGNVFETNPRTAASRHKPASSRIGVTLLIVGFIGLFATPPLAGAAATSIVLWTSVLVLALGVAFSAAMIVARISALFAPRSKTGGWLIGHRINSLEPGSTTRTLAIVGALVVCLTAALSFLGLMTSGINARVPSKSGSLTVSMSDHGGVLRLSDVNSVDGIEGAVPIIQLQGNRDDILAVAASCDELAKAIATPSVPGCRNDRVQWLSTSTDSASLSASTSFRLAGGTRLQLPADDDVLSLRSGRTDLLNGVLFAPTVAYAESPGTAYRYILSTSSSNVTEVMARLSSRAPTSSFDYGSQVAADSDSQEGRDLIVWLTVGAVTAMLFACFGVTVGAVGETEARRDRLRGLAMIGAPRKELARAHIATTLFPALVVIITATAVAWAINTVMTLVDDRAQLGLLYYPIVLGTTIAMASSSTIVTLPTALRSLGVENQR